MRLGTIILLLWSIAAVAQSGGTAELLRKAVAEQEQGDLAAAVRDYKAVLQLRPGLTQARANMAAALAGLGRFDEAIEAYRDALAKSPANTDIRVNLALAYFKKGDLPSAEREYVALHQANRSDTRISLLLARCYLATGHPTEAATLLAPIATARPDDLDVAYLRGMALIRSGQPDEGVAFVERVARQADSADAYLLAGATQLNLGRLAPAQEDLEKVVQLNPNLPGALAWAGLARDRAGDEDGAKKAFSQALKRDPRDFEASLHLGAVLYREKEYAEAKPHVDRALEIDPGSPMARYAAALIKAATGAEAQALTDLEGILRGAPNWLEPRVKLSSLYFKLGRDAEGRRERDIVDQLTREHKGKSSPFEN